MVLTGDFNRLFSRLVVSFKRYHDVPRSPDSVPAIGAARIDLDVARREIAIERERIAFARTRAEVAKQTSVSADDLARLRTFASGFVSG